MFWDKFTSISPAQLQLKLPQHPLIVDVRQPDEYQDGHIPGSVNVPLMTVMQNPAIVTSKATANQPIYVVCHSGARSRQAAKILSRQARDVINIAGGMMQWNGKIKRGNQR